MLLYPSSRNITCLLTVWALSGLAAGAPVTVYDNATTNNTTGSYAPNGFWPFNAFAPNEPMGDQITLNNEAPEREIVQFDVVLSSSQPVNLLTVTLAFYEIDADTWFPGDQLWATSAHNVAVDGITAVIFSVPSVVVPDSFIWVVGADSALAGLATYDAPSIGSSADFYWDHDTLGGQWYPLRFDGSPIANFGAKIVAVPEPGVIAILAVSGASMICKERVLRHRRAKPANL